MASFEIPDDVINGVAAQIHAKTTKDYKIPLIGSPDNLETPQIFEIMPFDQIDKEGCRFYAVDGSCNSHNFYNGVSLCFYQAGYVCFKNGRQIQLSDVEDPIVLGKVFHGHKMLILNDHDLSDLYDELIDSAPIASMLAFFDDKPEVVFPYNKEVVTKNPGTLLHFAQEVLAWIIHDFCGEKRKDALKG